MRIEQYGFGTTKSGEEVTAYKIINRSGSSITVIDFGAILESIVVPDAEGNFRDVALGYDNIASYELNPPYFGSTIGRNGNRIEGGTFCINGKDYKLACNENGKNNLHSGPDGYEHRMWKGEADEEKGCVSFSIFSPAGDQGFPGNFKITVTYTLTEENAVEIHYEGVSDADTVANLTNHSYFNLDGHDAGSIMDHELLVHAEGYTPVDEYSIPYGIVESVEGTPFDFRQFKPIKQDAECVNEQLAHTGGYDHNFCLDGEGMKTAAELVSKKSGILMVVMTDQPGIQFYAGNGIGGPAGKGGVVYGKYAGLALETQHFPNSINVLAFESPKLEAGETYSTTTCYKFSTIK